MLFTCKNDSVITAHPCTAKKCMRNKLSNLLPLLLDDCMDAGGRATQGAVAERVVVKKIRLADPKIIHVISS
jgi:hypothetical protein